MKDDWRAFLGLCFRAGHLASGEQTVRAALRQGRVHLLLVARDAGHAAVRRVAWEAERNDIPVFSPGLKEELGRALGQSPRSILAVTDAGMARTLAGKLEQAGFESVRQGSGRRRG